jgi:lysozyme
MTYESYQRLRRQLTGHEARRRELYDDATGRPLRPGDTILGNITGGIGHNFFAHPLSDDLIDLFFARDLADAVRDVQTALPWFVEQDDVRQRVLVELAFNLGVPRLLQFGPTLEHIKLRQYDDAAAHLLASDAGQKLPGRYGVLAEMVRTGVDPGVA